MPIFMKLADGKGQATDSGHQDWILCESLSASVFRSIPQHARDQQRTQGSTDLGDVIVVRQLDKSSTKLAEACANGTFFNEVQIDLCTTIKNKQEPFLQYKLKHVIISGYMFHGDASGDPLPSEEITMNCTEAEWIYMLINPNTGKVEGSVPAKYSPGRGKS